MKPPSSIAPAPAPQARRRRHEEDAHRYLDSVGRHVAFALERGRRPRGCADTPLFADGWDLACNRPVEWRRRLAPWDWADPAYFDQPARWVLANPACQQNLYRLLHAYAQAVADDRPREAAAAAIRFAFERLRAPNGLLHWGGHSACDLRTGAAVWSQPHHELKAHLPDYDLLAAVDPAATRDFLEAFWGAHILDWRTLEMSAHGAYAGPSAPAWKTPFRPAEPFFPSRGDAFLRAGIDLIWAGFHLAESGVPEAAEWARRLEGRYEAIRDGGTGLRGLQYTISAQGDRARARFGHRFGERVCEGTLLGAQAIRQRVGVFPAFAHELVRRFGEEAAPVAEGAMRDLEAFLAHLWDAPAGCFRAALADGTRLTGSQSPGRPGYYPAWKLAPVPASPLLWHGCVLGWRLGGSPSLWRGARELGLALGAGDIGAGPGETPAPSFRRQGSGSRALLAWLDLFEATHSPAFLDAALDAADRLLRTRFDGRVFRIRAGDTRVRFDDPAPLALLHLVAVLRGQERPVAPGAGAAFFQGHHEGAGRITDLAGLYGCDDAAPD